MSATFCNCNSPSPEWLDERDMDSQYHHRLYVNDNPHTFSGIYAHWVDAAAYSQTFQSSWSNYDNLWLRISKYGEYMVCSYCLYRHTVSEELKRITFHEPRSTIGVVKATIKAHADSKTHQESIRYRS